MQEPSWSSTDRCCLDVQNHISTEVLWFRGSSDTVSDNRPYQFSSILGIQTVDEIPDEKTVWATREKLSEAGTFDQLFSDFRKFLDEKGLSFNEGKIIDATFVEAPKQRNTKEENKQIKEGKGKDLWNPEDGDNEKEQKSKKAKKSHKDIDARWTKKRGENHYGYKNHVKADKRTKLIERYHTTDASVHDSQVIEPLIDKEKTRVKTFSLMQGMSLKRKW